jgi:hypothetical protein
MRTVINAGLVFEKPAKRRSGKQTHRVIVDLDIASSFPGVWMAPARRNAAQFFGIVVFGHGAPRARCVVASGPDGFAPSPGRAI